MSHPLYRPSQQQYQTRWIQGRLGYCFLDSVSLWNQWTGEYGRAKDCRFTVCKKAPAHVSVYDKAQTRNCNVLLFEKRMLRYLLST